MYFWRIDRLKRELASGPLPPRRVLPYLIVWLGILSLISVIPMSDSTAPWEWLTVQALYYTVATGLGVWWSYRANGGAVGVDFASRLLAIWWVLGVRFLVVLLVPLGALYVILTPDENSHSYLADLISALLFTVVYYWRAAVHLRDIVKPNPQRPSADISEAAA